MAELRDTQNYLHATDSGCGIHETNRSNILGDINSWNEVIDWIESHNINDEPDWGFNVSPAVENA